MDSTKNGTIPSTSSSAPARPRFSHLYSTELTKTQCPIIYSPEYNIHFFGVEKVHPFDSKKWGRVFTFLVESGTLNPGAVVEPKEIQKEDLLFIHSPEYINSLGSTCKLACILEVCVVVFLPSFLVNKKILRPFRFQTGGSVLAARLALQHGWAINIGGGFHHAKRAKGGGFCVYADVTLLISVLFEDGLIKKAMIVDLDAHQGNGHESDFTYDNRVYILDFYNEQIYPGDEKAKRGISRAVPLKIGTDDKYYLSRLETELEAAFAEFTPQLVVYVAGTDSLSGDPLGLMCLSSKGIVQRDELVFQAARERKIPIVMLTSGGYQQCTARVIADSILNLHAVGLIELK